MDERADKPMGEVISIDEARIGDQSFVQFNR